MQGEKEEEGGRGVSVGLELVWWGLDGRAMHVDSRA